MKFKELFKAETPEEVKVTPSEVVEEIVEAKKVEEDDIELPASLWLHLDKNDPEQIKRLKYYAKHEPAMFNDMVHWN